MTLSQQSNISIIIPVYNGGEAFHSCLVHAFALNPSPLEIIVVADGDTDGSRDLAQAFGAKVFINPISKGPAHARNIGAQNAHGDMLFFVDADVALPENALNYINQAFQTEPELAALIGSYDDAPAEQNFISQYKNLFHHYVHQTSCEQASTFWGACGAIRRDIFLESGGFDEQYRHPSIEDIELGYRLTGAGYRIKLVKALQVKHLKRWNASSLIKTDFLQRAIPWTFLILRDGKFANDLNLKMENRVSVILVYSLLLALPLAWQWSFFSIFIAFLACGLLVINISVYRFFLKKRGFLFTLQMMPWHWFYYFYSGLAFATVLAYSKCIISFEKMGLGTERVSR
ncbi:MAG: glycosyltransferase family 2 protein [Candidatus Parabeggiatoa sp.]|nr:glycosyltransferase family 2 protein [Candidatus Parabeggiatoa sp.]